MSTFDAVLAQYEKNKNATGGNNNKVSQEDRMKKYFTTLYRIKLFDKKNC